MTSLDILERKSSPTPEPRAGNSFESGHHRFVIPPAEAKDARDQPAPENYRDHSVTIGDGPRLQVLERRAPPLPLLTPPVPTRVEQVPEGPSWLHEVEHEGYRVLAYVGEDAVSLRRISERGVAAQDWSTRLPGLAAALWTPTFANSVLDGVVCALRPDGVTCVQRVEQALAAGCDSELVFIAFDLPFAAGHDLRGLSLIERKRALRKGIEADVREPGDRRLRFAEHVVGAGAKVFDRACELGVEGVVSRRVASRYEDSRTWQAVKCARRLSLVVGGFTAPHGSRRHFGALLVGGYDSEGRLHYRGKVGSGFCEDSLEQLRPRLDALQQDQPAFLDPPSGSQARGVSWVTPTVVIDVEYGELTHKGRLRHARFKGLAGEPAAVAEPRTQAVPLEFGLATLSNANHLVYPAGGLSKRDLADYAARLAEWMLPHVRGRALAVVRMPQASALELPPSELAEGVCASPLPGADGATARWLNVTDALGLIGLFEMSAVEVHSWTSRIDKLDHPDRLIFELEPGEGVGFARVVEAALEFRDQLDAVGLASFVKTSGGGGLHVVVPVQRRRSFALVESFCRVFAARMVAHAPTRYVLSQAGAPAGAGKIVIDHTRNGLGATSLAPYSPRANSKALVSTPLAWDELCAEALRPEAFCVASIPARLDALERDPWELFFEHRQWVTKASFRALGLDPDSERQPAHSSGQ